MTKLEKADKAWRDAVDNLRNAAILAECLRWESNAAANRYAQAQAALQAAREAVPEAVEKWAALLTEPPPEQPA